METQDPGQFKYGAYLPTDESIEWSKRHILDVWPELTPYVDKIHFVYAGNGNFTFVARSVESVACEIETEYKNGKKNFFYECFFEGLMVSNLDKLHDALALIPDILPHVSIIYATGDLDHEKSYADYCKIYNRKKLVNVVSGAALEKSSQKFLEFSLPYITNLKPKKYLTFNRNERQHRIDLVNKLIELNLLDEGFVSFQISEQNFDMITQHDHYIHLLPFKNKLPFTLNDLTNRQNPVDVRLDDLEYFQGSYFSIVTETLFYSLIDPNSTAFKVHVNPTMNGAFLTEKIYKCLALRHPFIVLAPPYFLKALRQRGFKTFSPIINEQYDNIENDEDRFNAVMDEINRMCKLSDREYLAFCNFSKGIVEHNYRQLKSQKDFRVTKNILDLLK